MGRARGANAGMALKYETSYGTSPGGNYVKMPFISSDLGEEQNLLPSDVLGLGRDPARPEKDEINNTGSIPVPLDLRSLGYWLKLLLGAPTTTQGVRATGDYTFSGQPADTSVLTVNGVAITFVAGTPGANQVKIGATLADTIAAAVTHLNASANTSIDDATYSADIAGTKILITHDTIGTAGNSFTIVAGSSPATNATASGATLAGGSAAGAYNHIFASGSVTLPSASIEVQNPDVPSYRMNYGVMINSIAIALQRSGHLSANLGYIAQGEATPATTTAVGTPTELTFERFSQFAGQIYRDGVPLGEITNANFNYSNGLDPIEVIRSDGRIGGSDPGGALLPGDVTALFSSHALLDLAVNGTAVELWHQWKIGNAIAKSLTIVMHQVDLPRPKLPITNAGMVRARFPYQGSKQQTIGRALTVTLVNDVSAYA